MDETKKEKLEKDIIEFIKCSLKNADRDNKLDHLNIEISNHSGNLQMDYTLRDRRKIY